MAPLHGTSDESKQLGRHLPNHNGSDVVDRMLQPGIPDPVGLIQMTNEAENHARNKDITAAITP